MSENFTKPQLTARGHKHGEAFMLMRYACKSCAHAETIWNSRDGVTPFGARCPSCGKVELYHVQWERDEYAPNHKLNNGQQFWRDGTVEEAEDIIRRRIDKMKPPEDIAELLLKSARDGEGEFQAGWPTLSRAS
jgi:hypothetical protein